MIRRVALISEHASPLARPGGVDCGGQNVYVGQVARGLAAAGYAVDVFTRRDDAQADEIVAWQQGVRVIHVPAGPSSAIPKEQLLPYMADFTAWMLRFCTREKASYDLIHANFWMSGLVAADIKAAVGIPFVITFHALGRIRRRYQGDADRFPDVRFAIEDRVVREAGCIIAECPQDEVDLLSLYGADRTKLIVVPCGFDPAELAPIEQRLARHVLGLPRDERLILQLGRLVPRKGIDTVIRSVARLVQRHDVAARLLIVGGDTPEPDPVRTPEIARLQAVAEAEGILDRVTFFGCRPRDALRYWYSAADIFAVAPWYEPFGITPVEAMACGTPVVGAAVGGIAYSVRDGETGYLVPPNDPDAMAERLAYLFSCPDLLARLGQQAQARANELFTWSRVASEVAGVYERVLSAQRCGDAAAIVDTGFAGALEAMHDSRRRLGPAILDAAGVLGDCFALGGKLLICGNGGSAADAQHLAAELVGRFMHEDRAALPALALPIDSATMTAWSNDVAYEDVFARQVEAFGRPGDVLLGISTSGRSRNLVRAFQRARSLGLRCIALLGRDGGDLRGLAETAIVVPSCNTQHIQEVQMVVLHLLCELIEARIAGDRPAEALVGAAVADPRVVA